MNKLEKLKLQRDLYGLSLSQCPIHKLPLQRHDGPLTDDCGNLEGCYDCPGLREDGQPCDHHVHEKLNVPWAGIDFGEEPNEVQKRLAIANEEIYKMYGIRI